MSASTVSSPEFLDSLVSVLELVRRGAATTRPEIAKLSGLGRNVVTQRVAQLLESGLLAEAEGVSTGGRAARKLRFRSNAGYVLVAELGATSLSVALSDLTGHLTGQASEPSDVADGPESILARVAELFDGLLSAFPVRVWGVGIGLPGPVEYTSGRPVAPPIMPGWDGFDVRGYFSARYDAPTWVDNDVNVMMLGELRDGLAKGCTEVVYVKVGSGIGAGVISGGRLHRGAQGCAGDIGHMAAIARSDVLCRCGQTGCLEALAGGLAIARDGQEAASERRSVFLNGLDSTGGRITAADVGYGAQHGDAVSLKLITNSALLVGETLSQIVNFFNPSLILIGGGVSDVGDLYLATVRQVIFGRSLPLATRSLIIEKSRLGNTAGLKGAAFMVVDELLSRQRLPSWIDQRTPAGQPALTA